MRALTPTLLAAQRSLGGVASVRLRIENRELRWVPLLDDDSSTCQTAGCSTEGGIVRARITAAGTLDVQRIARPERPEKWLTWATLAHDAEPASDVAVSAVEGEPARLRLFYVRRQSGSRSVSWLQSADGGRNWSAPATLIGSLADSGAPLASANAQLLYHDPADGYLKLSICNTWEGGSWAASPWAQGGALATRHGVAAGLAAGVYRVVTCDEESPDVRRLRTGTFTIATATWSDPVPVVPPGLPAAAFVPRQPSLAHVDGLWRLCYLETFSGLVAYAEPTVIHSTDWEHWSFACWVPLEGFGASRRAVLIHHAGTYYLALERAVWRAPAYDAAAPSHLLVDERVASYLVEEGPWNGQALVELERPGSPDGAIQPLARLVIERGYRTATGEEREPRAPYYVVSVASRRGGSRPTLRLEAEDGWGLLRRWRPDTLYLWSGKSVAWLIAEVLYRAAGLTCRFDDEGAWGTVLGTFALAPSNWSEALGDQRRAWLGREMRPGGQAPGGASVSGTGLDALRTLLAKVSGCGAWQADGDLHCFIPATQAPAAPYVIGSGGEILDGLYGQGLIIPTQTRVFGDGVAAVASTPEARGAPRRYVATYVDPHLRSASECAGRASGLAYGGQARRVLGWVETPCQCGLELYDLVVLNDPHLGAPGGLCLRVAGIVERYDPAQAAFITRITLEGA